MALVSIENELEDAMSNVGVELSDDILSKCAAIAKNHQLSVNQMATCWEAHSLNCDVDQLNAHTFASYRATLLKGVKLESIPTVGAVVSRPAMSKRSIKAEHEEGNDTNINNNPTKKHKPLESPPSTAVTDGRQTPEKENQSNTSSSGLHAAVLVTPPKSKPSAPAINRYENRKNAGQTVTTYNPHDLPDLPVLPTSSPDTKRTCIISQPDSFPHVNQSYRHLNDANRAKALNQQLTGMRCSMVESYSIHINRNSEEDPTQSATTNNSTTIADLEVTGIPRQSAQTNIGRICNEAHSGKINATSILLEGDSLQSNGARIALDVHSKEGLGYSFFPGQLVAVEGMNGTGPKMTVDKLYEGLPLPMPRHQTIPTTTMEDGDGFRVMMVSGPYTTSHDLEYQPLADLLDIVSAERPEVVILTGPFVDMTHPLLLEGEDVVLEYMEEDGVTAIQRHVTYETLFAAKVAADLDELYEVTPDLRTQFVLVPSMEDAIAEHIYPQPPLEDTIPGGKQISHFPETEAIPYGSLCLDTIETAGGKTLSAAQKHPRIHLVSNPSTILINDVTIGVTSTDALLHLSTEEINANLPPGSRLTRLAEHFLEQRSYYPMYPPPENFGMNVDVMKRKAYSIPVQLDLLVLPSKLAPLAKDVKGGTVVINPGHLVRGTVGGTYAIVDLHPVKKDGVGGNHEAKEGTGCVKDRIRVEIRRI